MSQENVELAYQAPSGSPSSRRSDGYGATLIGLILCALGGTSLFVRLVAVLAG